VGSKEDIFFLIHDFVAGSAMEILNRSIGEIQDPIEKMRRMVRGEFNLMDQWADAVLLIYQESHILGETFLKQLLTKERAHLEKFEYVLTEAIEAGRIRECNVRLVSNLIKSMIDTWALKRWDLRGHALQLEAEQAILDLVFHGLLKAGEQGAAMSASAALWLQGKTALVVNAGTIIGKGVCNALEKNGATVVAGGDELDPDDAEKRFGPIDVYVHDLGIGTTALPPAGRAAGVAEQLGANFQKAQALTRSLGKRMKERRNGRIVFIAPWRWDRHVDPIVFETVTAGVCALCRAMAEETAAFAVNVNCLVPGYIRADRPTRIEKALKDEVMGTIPAGRMGEVADVAESAVFLITDAAKYLTGQILKVSGGF
jgi:3-oxoacyl-[acyl-carrier protein] reductase